jgi:hypothetical protein
MGWWLPVLKRCSSARSELQRDPGTPRLRPRGQDQPPLSDIHRCHLPSGWEEIGGATTLVSHHQGACIALELNQGFGPPTGEDHTVEFQALRQYRWRFPV